MHRDVAGWTLSIVEEIAFLGFVSVILFVAIGHVGIKEIWTGGTGEGIDFYYRTYIKYSIIAYPMLIAISTLCEKTGILYDDEYSDMSVIGLIFFNIWNDIIFPIYALINIVKAPIPVLIAVGLWIAYVMFLYFKLR